MGIKDRISSGVSKHSASEILIVVIIGVIASAIALYYMITNFAIDISFSLGDVLIVYVPCILIMAVGGALLSHQRGKDSKFIMGIGLGMVIVPLALIVMQTLEILYFGVSL
jgi:hypothetical protein